jgi:hypothetical protein
MFLESRLASVERRGRWTLRAWIARGTLCFVSATSARLIRGSGAKKLQCPGPLAVSWLVHQLDNQGHRHTACLRNSHLFDNKTFSCVWTGRPPATHARAPSSARIHARPSVLL